jgi:hypothetical protein
LKEPSGILAIHISNSYLDLRPVLFSAATRLGLKATSLHSTGDGGISFESNWVLLSAGGDPPVSNPRISPRADRAAYMPAIRPWTDDYSNLFEILNR